MSLVSQAVVAVTHYLLDGMTWAGSNIWEQPLDPIGDLMAPEEQGTRPVICVYVEKAQAMISGRRTQGDKTEIDLKIIVYVAPGKVKLPDEDAFTFELDGTTAGLTLNVVSRQVDAAFHIGDSGWAAIWKGFVYNLSERIERYLLVEIENGVKIPAIEICYRANCIPDPDFGCPIGGSWLKLDTALRAASDDKAKLADLFKTLIENPTGLPEYKVFQLNDGLTDAGMAVTGLAPVPGATDENGDPVELEDVDLVATTVITPEDE